MLGINLIDTAGVLSPADFERLGAFVSDNCLCSIHALKMLRHVALRNDGASGYSGYWTVRYTVDCDKVKDIQGVIILNSFYLKTVTQMEKALAHEFGHHWTLGHLMGRQKVTGWFAKPAPRRYYHIRGLDPNRFARDDSRGWAHCDKEVLAEDYRYTCSPYRQNHRMAHLVNHPAAKVGEFIRMLSEPISVT